MQIDAISCICQPFAVTTPSGTAPSPQYLQRFSDALVSEIKAEMGRRGTSSRALGRQVGRSSQYMSDRLDGGNSKTGRRVTLTVKDLAAIAAVFGLHPADLIERAKAVADGEDAGRVVGLSPARPAAPGEIAAHDSAAPISQEREAPETP